MVLYRTSSRVAFAISVFVLYRLCARSSRPRVRALLLEYEMYRGCCGLCDSVSNTAGEMAEGLERIPHTVREIQRHLQAIEVNIWAEGKASTQEKYRRVLLVSRDLWTIHTVEDTTLRVPQTCLHNLLRCIIAFGPSTHPLASLDRVAAAHTHKST